MSDTANTNAAAPKKGGKKIIIIVAVLFLVLGGAGGGFYWWKASSVAAAENTEEKDSAKAKKAKAKKAAEVDAEENTDETEKKGSDKDSKSIAASLPDDSNVKQVIELQPFIVNLADADQARYLRMTVSLGVGGEAGASEKPNPLFTTRVRNAMLAVLAQKKSEDVLTVEGKTKLRKELLKAAQAASDEPEVIAIYITDFIVQL